MNKLHVAFDIQAIDFCVVYGFLYKNIELKKNILNQKKNYWFIYQRYLHHKYTWTWKVTSFIKYN